MFVEKQFIIPCVKQFREIIAAVERNIFKTVICCKLDKPTTQINCSSFALYMGTPENVQCGTGPIDLLSNFAVVLSV